MAGTAPGSEGRAGAEGQQHDSLLRSQDGSSTRRSSASGSSGDPQNGDSEKARPPCACCNPKKWTCERCCVIFLAIVTVALSIALAVVAASGRGPSLCQEPCPKNWTYTEGFCYYFSAEETDWDSSRHFCSSQGASLLVLKTQEDLISAWNKICQTEFWIGLRYIKEELKWVDGSPYNQSLFHIQDFGDCAFIWSRGISMSGCDLPQRRICRMKPDWSGGEAGASR